MEAITLTGLEEGVGALVLFGLAFVGALLGGGYVWYRLVSYPLARRGARQLGFIVVGENVFGDDILVEWAEADWRPATFKEWRSVKTYEGEAPPKLWPTRTFNDDEVLC